MITGFNTDVRHDGRIYHVQTEDRGSDNPVLESLVYIGGTIVAKKSTPYSEQLSTGATEEAIASLLKRQHQVIIAAIKAGRIEDLIRHSAQKQNVKKEQLVKEQPVKELPVKEQPVKELPMSVAQKEIPAQAKAPSGPLTKTMPGVVVPTIPAMPPLPATSQATSIDSNKKFPPVRANTRGQTGGLDLDQVIADYLKRNSEQGKLDLKVITPNVFTAGKSIGLRIQVACNSKPEPDAVVTIKVIGTAFKPQVYIGRAGRDGVASFSLTLPAFTAGTAALVIEAQSGRGRGELKHLIRRA
jgi:hypothetical protein